MRPPFRQSRGPDQRAARRAAVTLPEHGQVHAQRHAGGGTVLARMGVHEHLAHEQVEIECRGIGAHGLARLCRGLIAHRSHRMLRAAGDQVGRPADAHLLGQAHRIQALDHAHRAHLRQRDELHHLHLGSKLQLDAELIDLGHSAPTFPGTTPRINRGGPNPSSRPSLENHAIGRTGAPAANLAPFVTIHDDVGRDTAAPTVARPRGGFATSCRARPPRGPRAPRAPSRPRPRSGRSAPGRA